MKMLAFITAENGFVYCQKLAFNRYGKHQHVCKECFQTQNTHILYLKPLQMWYFLLHLEHVESKYTPEMSGLFVILSAQFKTAVSQDIAV